MAKCIKTPSNRNKWVYSIMAGIVFFLLASPFMFETTSKIFNAIKLQIVSSPGCPNTAGVLIHSIVFILIMRLLMF